MEKKRPDSFSENARSLAYPSNIGAPSFTVPDVLRHKSDRGITATHFFESKFDELKAEYFKLVSLVEDTELVYNAEYAFIPIIGRTYHLYIGATGKLFLSIIPPDQWTTEFKGSFKYTTDNVWERVNGD